MLHRPVEDGQTKHVGDGRFALGRRIGSGAQGDTFEAVDKREGRRVAVKRFEVRGAESWKQVELAQREAEVLASLSHPALPGYVTNFEEDGCLYLVMEYVEGDTLRSLSRAGKLSRTDVEQWIRQMADILEYLHHRAPPVIHRDIKPSNVLRRPDGSFALVDFGAVRDHLRPDGGSTVVGTYGYMAPEQFQGRALPGTDVYAVGATALAALVGAEPETLPHKGLALDVDAAVGSDTPRGLREALKRLLEPDPDKRPSSVKDVLPLLDSETSRQSGGPAVGQQARQNKRQAKESKRYRRHRRRGRRRHSDFEDLRNLPRELRGLARTGVELGLSVAEAAVYVVTQVILPVVLTLIAVGLSPQLRRAAREVRLSGQRAGEDLRRARREALAALGAAPNEGAAQGDTTVHTPPAPRARVATEPDVIEAEFEELDEPPRRRRR